MQNREKTMPNIWEQLGLAPDATVEDVLSAYYQHNNRILDATRAGEKAELIPITEPIYALCAREYERGRKDGTHVHSVDIAAVYGYEAGLQAAWERMREYCPSSIQTDNTRWRCWIQRDEQMALKPCEYTTCPLLRDEEGKGEAEHGDDCPAGKALRVLKGGTE